MFSPLPSRMLHDAAIAADESGAGRWLRSDKLWSRQGRRIKGLEATHYDGAPECHRNAEAPRGRTCDFKVKGVRLADECP